MGLMPHPERAIDQFSSTMDGQIFFNCLIEMV